MKKLLVVLALVFAGSTINAQEATAAGKKPAKVKATAEQRAQKSVDNLDKTVTLTEDQKPKIYDLALTRAKKVDAIREANKGKKTPEEKEAMKKEIKAAHKEYRDGVKPILTQEQKDKLKAKAKERKAAKGNKKPNKLSKKAEETKNDVSEEELDEVISVED
jgi:Spy/CpxP family protein refolding chaperone